MVVAVILPLRDVLQLAEDVAVLDLVSGGRVDVLYGAGYRYEEFAMFDVDIRRRGELMEESVQALQQAFTGEPFEYRGGTGAGHPAAPPPGPGRPSCSAAPRRPRPAGRRSTPTCSSPASPRPWRTPRSSSGGASRPPPST